MPTYNQNIDYAAHVHTTKHIRTYSNRTVNVKVKYVSNGEVCMVNVICENEITQIISRYNKNYMLTMIWLIKSGLRINVLHKQPDTHLTIQIHRQTTCHIREEFLGVVV